MDEKKEQALTGCAYSGRAYHNMPGAVGTPLMTQSEIYKALDELTLMINNIENRVAELNGRLVTVMKAVPTVENVISKEKPYSSPIAISLRELSIQSEIINEKLNTMLNLLAL